MSSFQTHLESRTQLPPIDCAPEESSWYAVHTMARHEKRVASQFEEKRVCTFLPLLRQTHKWSERRRKVEVPMFSCYAFVRIAQTTEERLKVLRTPGVLGFVGSERQGTPIPDEQIESLLNVSTVKSFFPLMSQSTLQQLRKTVFRALCANCTTVFMSDSDAERYQTIISPAIVCHQIITLSERIAARERRMAGEPINPHMNKGLILKPAVLRRV